MIAVLLFAASSSAFYAHTVPVHRAARASAAVAIIEPELYMEFAIYDADKEQELSELQKVVKQAEAAAQAATADRARLQAVLDEQSSRLESMEQEVADQRAETSHLRENLQKQAASAAASAAAASSLEIEVTKLLRQLDDQGNAAAAQLKSETTSLRNLLDDQATAAQKSRTDAERAEEDKKALRAEIDERIIEASEARRAAEQLAADLAATEEKNQDYLDAIEQIARVAATITSTQTNTMNM